jgi:hypothetical protein
LMKKMVGRRWGETLKGVSHYYAKGKAICGSREPVYLRCDVQDMTRYDHDCSKCWTAIRKLKATK